MRSAWRGAGSERTPINNKDKKNKDLWAATRYAAAASKKQNGKWKWKMGRKP